MPNHAQEMPEELQERPELPARYRDLSPHGCGSSSVVYLATDHEIGREVVIKVFEPRGESDAGLAKRRFIAAHRLASDLQHPGVVPIYDVGMTPAGVPWCSMKRVLGCPFAHQLSGAKVQGFGARFHRIVTLSKVAETIAFAHQRGCSHGALGAEKVVVGDLGEVQIIGWGRATKAAVSTKLSCDSDLTAAQETSDVVALQEMLRNVLGEALTSAEQLSSDSHQLAISSLAELCGVEPPEQAGPPALSAPVFSVALQNWVEAQDKARQQAELRLASAEAASLAQRELRTKVLLLSSLLAVALTAVILLWTSIQNREEQRLQEIAATAAVELGKAERLIQKARDYESQALANTSIARARWLKARNAADRANAALRAADGKLPNRAKELEPVVRLAHSGFETSDHRARLDQAAQQVLRRFDGASHLQGDAFVDRIGSAKAFLGPLGLRFDDVTKEAALLGQLKSAIPLSAALEYWLLNLRSSRLSDPRLVQHLSELVALLDPRPVRERLRQVLRKNDSNLLAEFATRDEVAQLPDVLLTLICQRLYTSGLPELSLGLGKRLLASRPDLAAIHFFMADRAALSKAGAANIEHALLHTMAAAASSPSDDEYRMRCALILKRLGREGEAALWEASVQQRRPYHPYLVREKVRRYLESGKPKVALDFVREAIVQNEPHPYLQMLEGDCLSALLRDAEARDLFDNLLRTWPGFAPGHRRLGIVSFNLGNYRQAIDGFRHYLQRKPQDVRARVLFGRALGGDNQWAAAHAEFQIALKSSPEHAAFQYWTGLAAVNSGKKLQAKALLQMAIREGGGLSGDLRKNAEELLRTHYEDSSSPNQ